MHTGGGPALAGEKSNGSRKGQVRILRAQHRARCRLGILGQDHRRRPRRSQRAGILRVGEEREIARLCFLDTGDALDDEIAIAFERQSSRAARSVSFNDRSIPSRPERSVLRGARGPAGPEALGRRPRVWKNVAR